MFGVLTLRRKERGIILLTASPTSDGSFSAVWTATIASKDAFFSIFQNLQDLHFFRTAPISKFADLLKFKIADFRRFLQKKIAKFQQTSAKN